MIGYLLGGTSFGLISLQAYKKREEQKKKDAIIQKVEDSVLAPNEWTFGEDVYSLKSELISRQLEENSLSPQKRKKYFEKTRGLLLDKYSSMRVRQQMLFQSLMRKGSNQPYATKIGSYYKSLVSKYEKKTEEQHLQKIKESIILTPKTPKSSKDQKPNSPQRTQHNSMINSDAFDRIISNVSSHLMEASTPKQSILYTEYKGESPTQALSEFLSQCKQNSIPVSKAILIHYFFGQGDIPTSYVLGVEVNEGDSRCDSMLGTQVAQLKKAEAFQLEIGQTLFTESSQPNTWLDRSKEEAAELRQAISKEIESKLSIGGVRQMKYVEVFQVEPSTENVISYSVQVPFGQNESAFDLRSKQSTQNINFHSSFKQFDLQPSDHN